MFSAGVFGDTIMTSLQYAIRPQQYEYGDAVYNIEYSEITMVLELMKENRL